MNLSEMIGYAMSEMFEVLLQCLSCISFIALMIAMMITIAEHKKEAQVKIVLLMWMSLTENLEIKKYFEFALNPFDDIQIGRFPTWIRIARLAKGLEEIHNGAEYCDYYKYKGENKRIQKRNS